MGTIRQVAAGIRSRPLALLAAALAALAPRGGLAGGAPVPPEQVEPRPRTKPVHSSYQTWASFSLMGPIRDPLFAAIDFIGGFYSDMHPAGVTVRSALGLRLPHGFSVAAGYAYSSFWNDLHVRGEEQSVFQQVGYGVSFSVVDMFARLRGEQRFRAASDVAVRLRTLLSLEVPLWYHAPLRLLAWDEIFFGINQPDTWQPSVLDQDQFFVGMAWTPGPHFRAELGYQGGIAPRHEATDFVHSLSASTLVSW